MTERYQGWQLDAMRSSGPTDERAAGSRNEQRHGQSVIHSGFTAINHRFQPIQVNLLPSRPSLADSAHDTGSISSNSTIVFVDQYLGLGENDTLNSRFIRRATTIADRPPSPEPDAAAYPPKKKPRRKRASTTSLKPPRKANTKARESIADTWKVTKPDTAANQSTAKPATPVRPRSIFLQTIPEESSVFEQPVFANPSPKIDDLKDGEFDIPKDVDVDGVEDYEFDGLEDDDFLNLDVQLVSSDTANALPTPQPSDPIIFSPLACAADNSAMGADSYDGWVTIDDEEEVDFLDLSDDILEALTFPLPFSTALSNPPTKPSTTKPLPSLYQNLADVTAMEIEEDYTHSILHSPIVRPAFPKPIRDRSPLIGVSASTCLRTCFRVGEALNTGCAAARNEAEGTSSSILIELYAKVVSSSRDESGVRQHFVFADLFHEDRPPFIKGTCECWNGCELWEYDCGRLLTYGDEVTEKRLCRAVGRIKRDGKDWRFLVLSIWAATWDDIEHVRGIVCET